MKTRIRRHSITAIVLAGSLLLFTVSCDREKEEGRPELPPLESLVMDFSAFDHQTGGLKSTGLTYENFFHASLSLFFWNAASTATIAVPAAAYVHALDQDPDYLGDHTWEWSFGFSLQGQSFEAVLTGSRISNEEFSMEMVLSPSGEPGQQVKWFDGVVRYDHTHALWNVYSQEGIRLLEAEWDRDYETGVTGLTYTYVEPGKEETGSHISYARDPELFYDASYTISLSDRETLIEWNSATLEGRVMDSTRFGDNEWHCWDAAENGLADKQCSPL